MGSENPNVKKMEDSDGFDEVKKRKRDSEGEGDGATPFGEEDGIVKKLKRVHSGKEENGGKRGNMGSEGEVKEVNGAHNSDVILNGGKGKGANLREFVDERTENNAENKRKRDRVEAEYEARRYGVEEREGKGSGVVGRKRKDMGSLEDIIADSKEGFDDESRLLRTVFVGNLPLKIKIKLLIKEFGKFGEVESVRIRSIPLNDSKLLRKGSILKKQINEAADSVQAYVVFRTEESAQACLAHKMALVGGSHVRVDRAYCSPRKKLKEDDHKRIIGGQQPKLGDRDLRFYHAKASTFLFKRRNPFPEETNSSPGKKFRVTKFTSPENNKKLRGSLFYQGLRASTSGIQEKTHGLAKMNLSSQKVHVQEEREKKRPIVATARKAETLKKAKQIGTKRKLGKQTPDHTNIGQTKKKARKFAQDLNSILCIRELCLEHTVDN